MAFLPWTEGVTLKNVHSLWGQAWHGYKRIRGVGWLFEWSAKRQGDDMLAVKKTYGPRVFQAFRILVYPRPEDVKHFKASALGVDSHGPASLHPGAVGTLLVLPGRNGNMFMRYAQSHYKLEEGKHRLPREVHKKYAEWRVTALAEAINAAHGLGKNLVISNESSYLNRFSDQFLNDVKMACKRLGVAADWRENKRGQVHVLIRPPGKK